MTAFFSSLSRKAWAGVLASAALLAATPASATLTVTPLTWNIVGLDSNTPATGPEFFPAGARVCSNAATNNVTVDFVWDSANAFVNLRPGSLSQIVFPTIGAGACVDAYFEVAVTKNPAAFDTTRRYHIAATDLSGTASTPTPREFYVEHLVSQSRNSITNVFFGPVGGPLTSVPAGGAMNLVVGSTYDIRLEGGTATGGYEQFAAFINFSNAIFRITNVNTTLSVVAPPRVVSPNSRLYADACLWENDPNSPNYRACLDVGKAGGSVVATTYSILIVGGGGSAETLNTLLYDFSGSSYHYNADYGVGARIANIIDPTTARIDKSFTPSTIPVGGVSTLKFTLSNPNAGALGGYNFTDVLPPGMSVAPAPNATTSGCGTPTFAPAAGATTLTFSNGTVAGNGTCTVTVSVTTSGIGSFNNVSGNLFIGTTDTGDNAAATLTVNNAPPPPPPLCGVTLARWNFETGFNPASPATTSGTGTATPGAGVVSQTSTEDNTITPAGTGSWRSNGGIATGAAFVAGNNDYFEFSTATAGFSEVRLTFDAYRTNNGPRGVVVFAGASNIFQNDVVLSAATTWFPFGAGGSLAVVGPGATTTFRIYGFNSNNTNPGSDFNLDNVVITGCVTPVQPTIAKSFTPGTIAAGATSTLSFTLTNTNGAALTGATFTDALPSGMTVASAGFVSNTCGFSATSPAIGATSLSFSGGTIPASGSCTVSVNVTSSTPGASTNISGFLNTTQTGENSGPGGSATATLTVVAPPSIAKAFDPSPILPNGTSTLSFTIVNPNTGNALSGVAFNDTFPVAPGAMTVAPVPNATTTGCGAPTFAPAAGAGSIVFSGGTIAAGGVCIVTVDVTAPTVGTYNNTSGNVSHVINAAPVNGNTATAALTVNPPNPGIALLKQVGPTATGPWSSFMPVNLPANVFYRFTIENTGDVPLMGVALDDPPGTPICAPPLPVTLPVADAADEDHLFTCVRGPIPAVAGSITNTAEARGTGAGLPVLDQDSAIYASAALTMVKSANPTTFSAAGQVINYSFLVTNSGFAPLAGPITVADDRTTDEACPAVSTVGDLDNFLDPGESITCTASYTITAADVIATSVTNTAMASNGSTTSPPDSETVTLSVPAPDLSLIKSDGGASVVPGGTVSYTLSYANTGTANATGVVLTDIVPANTTFNPGASTAGWSCVPNNNAGSTCTLAIGGLAMGANGSATFAVTVSGTVPAGVVQISNTAAVNDDGSNGVDPTPANNTSSDTTPLNAAPDLSLTKDDGGATVAPGGAVSYTLSYANTGNQGATGVVLTETVPANTTFNAGASTAGWSCVPDNNAGSTCTLAVGALAAGANGTATFAVTVSATVAAGVTQVSNTASVADDGSNGPDPTPGNNTASDTTPLDAAPDLSVSKSDGGASVIPGGTVAYTLSYANNGNQGATGVVLSETVPANTSFNAGASTAGWTCAPDNNAGSTCTLAIGSVAAGGNGSATFSVTVSATVPAGVTQVSNTASLADDGTNGPDPTPGNNSGSDTTPVTAAPDLSVTKSDGGTSSAAGGTIAYTLSYANNGNQGALGVTLTETVPANTTFNAGASTAGWSCAPSNAAGSVCTLTIGGLAAGANGSATFAVTVDDPVPGGVTLISNTASIADDGSNGADPTPADNTGSDTTPVSGADVSLVKTLDTAGPYTMGQSITYTLLIANAGPSTATTIQVTDTPTNLTITNVSGACVALPCTIASLASGANTSITVTATINSVGAFDNVATATATQPDPDPSNNTDDTGNNGVTGPSADVSIDKTLNTVGPYTVGQSVTYTLLVSNAGPSTATNIQVTDVPTGLTITNVSGSGCAALPCTIASLASGANTSITVTATITATSFDNSASANATEPDPDPSDNTDDTGNGGNASPSADVSVVKTLTTAGPYTAGQSVSFDLLIANAGPSAATNIQVTDTPANLTITNVSGACVALPCAIASLASGANTTITVTATINAVGAFSNSATVDADEPDPAPGNNTDADNGLTGASADVSISKTLTTAGPYLPGQSVSFDLLVANAGPSTATNVQVTDTPTNLTITNVSGACAALPCTIASLASGANTTITVTATIDASGAFDNVASANATEPDPDPTDNTDDTNNGGTAGALADLSLTKSVDNPTPNVGSNVTFTLTVSNAGPSDATGVVVGDTLPAGYVYVSDNGGGAYNAGTGVWTVGALANGGSASLQIVATVAASGSYVNAAEVTASDQADPDSSPNDAMGDDFDTESVAPVGTADLSIVKVASNPTPTVGSNVTFTLTASNGGPSTATAVTVTDLLPSGYTFVSATPSVGTYTAGTGIWAIGDMTSGANATLAIVATVNASGSYANTATIDSPTPDPDPTDDSDTETPVPVGSADLSIVKVASNQAPNVGSNVTFTLTASNAGPSTATAVTVNDLLPAGYAFVSATPSVGTYTAGTGVWAIGNLNSGASATLAIVATVNATGPYANTATIDSPTPDPDPLDDTDTETPVPVHQADLAVTKTGPATIERGQNVTFTIVVQNRGPNTAFNARLLDPTPAGLVFVSTTGACTGPFPCTLGNLANGEVRNLTATYSVPANYAGPNMIVNTVTAISDSQDPTPGDSSSSSSVLVPGFGAPQPTTIPVDARWALLLLAGLVMLVAGSRLPRRE